MFTSSICVYKFKKNIKSQEAQSGEKKMVSAVTTTVTLRETMDECIRSKESQAVFKVENLNHC